jgi:hypothetical protein
MQTDWHNLGDVVYRKCFTYQMNLKENFQFEDYLICGSQFGGPIAFIKDDKKGVSVKRTEIMITSSSGNMLAEFILEIPSKLVGFGWSDLEQLILVYEDCTFYTHEA